MGLRADIESRIAPFLFSERMKGDAAWQLAVLAMSVATLVLFVVYHGTLTELVTVWDNSDTFNHCFLIPPISLFLIWHHRDRLLAIAPRPSLLGLPIIAVAALVWLVGSAASIDFAEQLALVAMIVGLHVAVFGREATRINLFPLAFLFLAVPMGDVLIPHLQVFTAHAAVLLLRLVGVPVFTEGTYITIPNGSYFVAEACAGLRFLVATVTLGVLFGYLYFRSPWRWIAFMALSVALPISANAIRAFGIILIGFFTSTEFAGGFDHIFTGWIFFALVTIGFLAIGYSFSDRKHEERTRLWHRAQNASFAPARALSCVVPAIVIGVIPAGYNGYLRLAAPKSDILPLISPPEIAAPWAPSAAVAADWLPRFEGADSTLLKTYHAPGGKKATVFVGYYTRQRQDSELLGYGNDVVNPKLWRVVNHESFSVRLWGHDTFVGELQADRDGHRRLIRYWYWVDGEFTASPYRVKLLFARSKLLGGIQGAAVIAIGASYDHDAGTARAVIDDFLAHSAPIGDLLLAADGGSKAEMKLGVERE